MSSVRRLASRPSGVSLVSAGSVSPRPSAWISAGETWRPRIRATWRARSCDNCQFERNANVLIGTLSVWPTTRTRAPSWPISAPILSIRGTNRSWTEALPVANSPRFLMRTSVPWRTCDTVTRPVRISSSRNVCSFGGGGATGGGVIAGGVIGGGAIGAAIFRLAAPLGGRSASCWSVTSERALSIPFRPKNNSVSAKTVVAAMVDSTIDTESG